MVMTLGAKRRIRIAAYLLISVAALSVAGIVALRVHAGRVAKKAERLQADVLRLTPGVTTLGEVRRFVNQTERPEGYAGFDGPICDESACVVSVGQDAFLHYWGSPILRPLAVFGVRPANYVAIVQVGDGVVRNVSFGVFYQAARQQTFSGAVVLVQRFSSGDLRSLSVSRAHPAFAVCGDALRADGIRVGRYLTVGTATDSTTERIRLNLACVTSARGCSGPAELFQLENTSIPDLIQHTTPPQCPAETLAWSNNWPSGTYPK